MAMKSKKELNKIRREKYKELYGEYPSPRLSLQNGVGTQPKFALKKRGYKITNQKGAFGSRTPNKDGIVYQTFKGTNKERFMTRRADSIARKEGKNRIVEGAKGLLTRVLGE